MAIPQDLSKLQGTQHKTDEISADTLRNGILSDIEAPADQALQLFKMRKMNDVLSDAKLQPMQLRLFSEFWFENELAILFAGQGAGKSVLAYQIAESIASGENIPSFRCSAQPQKVLYFDFELSDKQLEARYAVKVGEDHYENHYVFSDNLIRLHLEIPATTDFANLDNKVLSEMETAVKQSGAKVVIVDNITYLGNDAEKAAKTLPLMKFLKQLKTNYDLSILVLAHTPKRDDTRPITANDLAGSKMFSNFADSIFAIGTSVVNTKYRYVKQLKQRNCENIYGADNVCVCEIDKPYNFLQMKFLEFCKESDHLNRSTEKENKVDNAANFLKSFLKNGEKPLAEIESEGKKIGINIFNLRRAKTKLKVDDAKRCELVSGKAKYYSAWFLPTEMENIEISTKEDEK